MASNHHGDAPRGAADELYTEMAKAVEQDRERMRELFTPEITLGKQEDFPAGAYGPMDEGALAFAVGHDERNGKVVIDFGSAVHWLALDADQARHLAQLILNHADATRTVPVAKAIRAAIGAGSGG